MIREEQPLYYMLDASIGKKLFSGYLYQTRQIWGPRHAGRVSRSGCSILTYSNENGHSKIRALLRYSQMAVDHRSKHILPPRGNRFNCSYIF
jgi:hypothetical protein